MVSIRDRVKDFYMTIPELELGSLFHVCTNEKCDYNGYYEGLVNAPVLINHHKVESISQAEKDLVSLLGFTLKEFSHVRYQEGGGTSTCRHCHVQYNGRELSASELWLPDIKQRAIDLGFVVKTSFDPKCCSGWGIFGETKASSYDNFKAFCEAANLTGYGAGRRECAGGHIWYFEGLEVTSMVAIVQPPPVCTEGTHQVIEMCPDGATEKRWRDCVNNEWVDGAGECPHECENGATKCEGNDLYLCVGNVWKIKEKYSSECGYNATWKLIGKDNVAKTTPHGAIGDYELKRITIPTQYKSGRVKIKAWFTSPYPDSVIYEVKLSDGWTMVWDPTSLIIEEIFEVSNLEWVSCGRQSSGNIELTSTIFEVYYDTGPGAGNGEPTDTTIFFQVKDISNNPLPLAKIKLNGSIYNTLDSGMTDGIQVPKNKQYNVEVSRPNTRETTVAVKAFKGDMQLQIGSTFGMPVPGPYETSKTVRIGSLRRSLEYLDISGNTLMLRHPLEYETVSVGSLVVFERDIYYAVTLGRINTQEGGVFTYVLPEEVMIESITQPETVAPGETVNVVLKVKDITRWFGKRLKVEARTTRSPIETVIPSQKWESVAGEIKTFRGSFVMPDHDLSVKYSTSYFGAGSCYFVGDERIVTTKSSSVCSEGETACDAYDLYKCVNGAWVLQEENSLQCGYEPPGGCTEGETKCEGFNLYECVNGNWALQQTNSLQCGYEPPPECTTGETKCEGYDLYECVNGAWVLTKKNYPQCGYEEGESSWEALVTMVAEMTGVDRSTAEKIIIGGGVAIGILGLAAVAR